jgi:hypothetical protein
VYEGPIVQMPNADNGAATAAAISFLHQLWGEPTVAVQVIFTRVEEIWQIAATGIALRGRTPFGSLDSDTWVVNLEAMEVEDADDEEHLRRRLQLRAPTYDGGVLIKINDAAVRYNGIEPTANAAEYAALAAAQAEALRFQYTVTGGSTDARPFALAGTTPHLVTLAIPCEHKHNQGAHGIWVNERVRRDDIMAVARLLTHIATNDMHPPRKWIAVSLSERLRDQQYGLSPVGRRRLLAQLVRTHFAFAARLHAGHYFPVSHRESATFAAARALSSLRATSRLRRLRQQPPQSP